MADSNKEFIQELIEKKILKKKFKHVFEEIDRENFVPDFLKSYAYEDIVLHIGNSQSLNQTSTIAYLIETLSPKKGDVVLEIGTGTGYQTALISKMIGSSGRIKTYEIFKDICFSAKKKLKDYKNVEVILGEGLNQDISSFDKIIINASLEQIPKELLDNIKEKAVLVVPVGNFIQQIIRITKKEGKIYKDKLREFKFSSLIS